MSDELTTGERVRIVWNPMREQQPTPQVRQRAHVSPLPIILHYRTALWEHANNFDIFILYVCILFFYFIAYRRE